MQISERKLRDIIRESLLQELTSFGHSRDGKYDSVFNLKSSREKSCPYYVFGWDAKSTNPHGGYDNESIQSKTRKVLNSKTGNEIKEKLLKQFPGLRNDLSVVDGSIDQLTTYALNYSYVTGTGCLEYYFLSKALDLVSFVIGTVDPEGAKELKSDVISGQPVIAWTDAIEERASDLTRGTVQGFVNVMPFYCLPDLADAGPNVNDIGLLEKGLEEYQVIIDKVLSYNTQDLKKAFENISQDMSIDNTDVIRSIQLGTIDIPIEDINAMKKEAAGSLIAAMGDALLNYSTPREDSEEFNQACIEFFSKNTLLV